MGKTLSTVLILGSSALCKSMYYIVLTVSAYIALVCIFDIPRSHVVSFQVHQVVQAAAVPTITVDGSLVTLMGTTGSFGIVDNAKLDSSQSVVLMSDANNGPLLASAAPYAFDKRTTGTANRAFMCSFDGNEVSSPATSNIYCRRTTSVDTFLVFKYSDLSPVQDGSSNNPLYVAAGTNVGTRGMLSAVGSFMFVTSDQADSTLYRIDLSSFTYTGTVTSTKSVQDTSAATETYRYGACDSNGFCYAASTGKRLAKFTQDTTGSPTYVSTIDLSVAGQLDSGSSCGDCNEVVLDNAGNNLLVATTSSTLNIAKIDLGTFAFVSRVTVTDALLLNLCENCLTAGVGGETYMMIILFDSAKDARFIKLSDMTELTDAGTFVDSTGDAVTGWLTMTTGNGHGGIVTTSNAVQKLITTTPATTTTTVSKTKSISKSLQSLTVTKTSSSTASLQSLTTTRSVSSTASLQSLTSSITRSATSSLQSLTSTRTVSLTMTRSLSLSSSSSRSATLQSLTTSKTMSKTASLQSLTSTRTVTRSKSLQSLTRTASSSSSLQSLTISQTSSISRTPQSLTSTKTISATASLQSFTTTRSVSSTASLQSLTSTHTLSTSASLQTLTNTLSRSASSSLRSLTRTVTVSVSLSPRLESSTKTRSKSQTLQSLTTTRSITSTASLQSLTLTLSSSKSATPFSVTGTRSRSSSPTLFSRSSTVTPISPTKTVTKSISVTPLSRSKSLTLFSVTRSASASLTKSSTMTSSRSNTATGSLQSLSVTLTLFSRSSTLSSSKTASKSASASPPPTLLMTRSRTATNTRSASLQSLTKTKTLSRSLQSLTKTKTKTSLVISPPATTTTTTTASVDNVINNLPASSNIINALVVSVPSCPSSLNSKCQIRHPQSNECRCPQSTYEQNITLLPSFAFLSSTSPTSQLIDRVGNPCVRNEFTLGICTASTSERFVSSYTRFGGTASENGICEQANPFTNDCSCRNPSTKASFAIATGSPSSLVKKFVTFCLPSNGDLSVFWTIHPDVATTSSASSNRAETSCVSPNGNVTCECAAGASKTTFGASIFTDSSSTDPVPGDLTFCKAKPAEPEEEVNLPLTTTGTVVGIVGGFIEGGGANAVVGIQVAALLMTLCDNNPNVSTSGAKSVVVFFEYPGLDPSLGGLAFMLTLTLGVFLLHLLVCVLLGLKRFISSEPIEFDPDRIDFFEDEIEEPALSEQIRFASLQLRFPHWSFFVMNIGFSGVVVESTILLQDTESDVNVLVGAIGLALAIIYIALTLYYSYWGLRSVAPQKLFDIVESDQVAELKKEKRKLKKREKKLKRALNEVTVLDDDETGNSEDVDNNYKFPPSSRRSRSSRHQTRQRSQSSPGRKVASAASRRNNSKKNSRSRSAFSPRSFEGSSSSNDSNDGDDGKEHRSSSSSSSSSGAEEEEDGHKWFSRRKLMQSPAASSKRGSSTRSSVISSPIKKSKSKKRVVTANVRDESKNVLADDKASSTVQMPADDVDVESRDDNSNKKHSVIVEDANENNEFSKDEPGDLTMQSGKLENANMEEVPTANQKNSVNDKRGPRSAKRNPLRAPPRRRKVADEEDTSSADEDLDLEDEEEAEGEEEEEEYLDGSAAAAAAAEEEELTENDKPPHYVKYGKAIQMFARYCGAAKYFLSDGWWIKFRLYNRRYASMYNSFQPRPTAWAPTIVRVFMFSVSIASSLGGCIIPLTYAGTVALLVAIFFLCSRPCRRPFDNVLLALQLILAAALAFSRSSNPELSVNLFYGVIAVTFVYVFHICLMEALESFSMSALELDARDKK